MNSDTPRTDLVQTDFDNSVKKQERANIMRLESEPVFELCRQLEREANDWHNRAVSISKEGCAYIARAKNRIEQLEGELADEKLKVTVVQANAQNLHDQLAKSKSMLTECWRLGRQTGVEATLTAEKPNETKTHP